MTTTQMTATHAIAIALGGEHRTVKDRAEIILNNLEESGAVTKAPHLGGFRWTLTSPHPSFPGDVVAEHGFYLNASQARYETLLVSPAIGLMLAAVVRKPGHMAKVVALTAT
jgi:hypothetical protein